MSGVLCANSIQAWAELVRAEACVLDAGERELRAEGFPPPIWYDLLLELKAAPEHHLRPVELEARLLLKQYHLSRVIDRMEAEQLVARRKCPTDARGLHIALLPAGGALLKKMWPAYQAAIGRHFAAKLGPGEHQQLSALLDKLLP